jgi:hypothetical protein
VIGLALLFSRSIGFDFDGDPELLKVVILALVAISLVLLRDPPKSAFAVAMAVAMIWLYPTSETRTETLRSFFGVHKIYDSDDGRFRILKHGSTIHGAQQIEGDDGQPMSGRPKPITYYHDKSAMSRVIEAVRARKGGPLHVAVIGLGTERWRASVPPMKSGAFTKSIPPWSRSPTIPAVSHSCRLATRKCRSSSGMPD